MRSILLVFLLTISNVNASEYEDIVEVLKYVETGNRPHLIGDGGDSFGVLQIQWKAVQDVNRYFGTSYDHEMMFQPECAEEVTVLYMKMGADLYKKKHGKEPTEEILVRNHNGGIYRGYRLEETKRYYKKYLIWKKYLRYFKPKPTGLMYVGK